MNTKQTRRKDKGLPGNGGQYAETEHAEADGSVGLGNVQYKTVSQRLNDAELSPKDLGLDYWRVDAVGLGDYGDGPEINAETLFDTAFCTRGFEEDVDEDIAQDFVDRALYDGDFQILIDAKYPNAVVEEPAYNEGPTITFHTPISDSDTLEDAGRKILEETGIRDYYNETEGGATDTDFNAVVRELALIKGGGEVRDLREWDALVSPKNWDREAAIDDLAHWSSGPKISWETLMGDQIPRTEGSEVEFYEKRRDILTNDPQWQSYVDYITEGRAKDDQLSRALEKGITIPADYEEALDYVHSVENGDYVVRLPDGANELMRNMRRGGNRSEQGKLDIIQNHVDYTRRTNVDNLLERYR